MFHLALAGLPFPFPYPTIPQILGMALPSFCHPPLLPLTFYFSVSFDISLPLKDAGTISCFSALWVLASRPPEALPSGLTHHYNWDEQVLGHGSLESAGRREAQRQTVERLLPATRLSLAVSGPSRWSQE